MRFYHYTRRESVDSIRQHGLVARPGAFDPLIDGQVAAVWLTTSDDWEQAARFDAERATARVVLELSVAETHLWQWTQLGPRLCAMAGGDPRMLAAYNSAVPWHVEWWCYLRSMPRERIETIELRP